MELRTEDILESITDVFFALDLRWRFTYLNERAVARARVARGEGLRREELIGRSCWEAFPELAGTVFEREFRRALTEHKTVEFEAYSPPTDSRVEVRVYPTSEGLAVYSRDITERTRAEEVLRNSEERFRATFEQAAVGIAHLAPDGKWLRVNQKLCDIVGYTREELLRKTFQEITHPDDLDADLEQYRRLLAGEIDTYSMEKRYVRKDDSIIWIELTVSLVREQPSREPSYFIAVIVDVSERKRAEEEVREAGRRRENILENITDAFTAVDREWRFTYVNEHTVRIVSELKGREFSREELVGQNIWEMFPNVLGTPAEVEFRLAMAEQRSSVFEYHWQDEGMEEEARPWFEIHIYPSEEGLSFYFRDVTERKGAEEELRRSEVFARSTLNSLSAHIAILDEKGWILATNLAWQRFAASNPPTTKRAGPGTNYLEVCDRATGEGSEEAFAFARGIRDVISGRLETFELEYPCHSPDEKRWFVGRVTRFPDTVPPKVVVTHENVTDLALAEGELEARARQQAAVAALGLMALEDIALGGLMDDAVALVARNLRLDYAKISELLPGGERLLMRAGVGWEEGLVGTATEEAGHGSEAGYTLGSEGPVVAEDLSTEGRFRSSALVLDEGMISCVSVIIHGSENPFGVLSAHSTVRRSFSEDDVNFLQEVANVLTIAIERRQAQQRVEEIREVERSRMARDLHDGALQDLSGAMAQLLLARTKPEDGLEPLSEALKQAERSVRAAIYGLALEGERERTFSELLEDLLELHRSMAPGLEIGLDARDGVLEEPLGKVGRELLRIVGEALTNARRHSGASSIRVGVAADEGRLIAEVEDDGLGFDPAAVGHASADGGVGLNAMRERARSIGGTLAVESGPGRGTKVRFEMVLEDQEGSEEEEVVRILLVEDHAAIREALASAFEAEGFEVVGQAGSLAQARRMIREAEEPLDVAVVDLGLPDGYGADLIGELREAHPHAQALVLSASLERADTARAVGRGAAGVLSKTAHLGEVLGAVRRLRAGETLMPLEEVVELLRFWSLRREEEREERMAIQSLTPREVEVLRALAEGLDSAGIAAELNIALRTERNHMSSILGKLGVHSQLQALVFALRHGVVEIR